jgi:hypothetical protein
MNLPEEVEILDRQYWIDKITGKFDMSSLEKKPKKPKKNMSLLQRIKSENRVNVFEFASEEIKKDDELNLLALDKRKLSFNDVDDSLLNNKDFVLKYVEQSSYPSFFPLSLEMKEDRDIFFAYYKKTHTCFRDILWKSKKYYNRDSIKELLYINGAIMEDLPNSYKDDLELAKIAIDQNPHNIFFLNKRTTDKICTDKEYCRNLLEKNRDAFEYISLKLRNDKDFVLPYIKKDYSLIEKLGKKLRGDKDFVAQFVSYYNFVEAITDELRKDEELMLKAMVAYPMNFYKIDKSLQTISFYTKAIELNPKCYSALWDHLQKEPDLIVPLLKHEFYYNDKSEKADPINLVDNFVMAECRVEYNNLPNKNSIDFNSFVRSKFLNDSLTAGLNEENGYVEDSISKAKRLKI